MVLLSQECLRHILKPIILDGRVFLQEMMSCDWCDAPGILGLSLLLSHEWHMPIYYFLV